MRGARFTEDEVQTIQVYVERSGSFERWEREQEDWLVGDAAVHSTGAEKLDSGYPYWPR